MIKLPFPILHEDRDVLVVDKPTGLITSSGPKDRRRTLWKMVQEYLATQRATRPGLIHRLDRDASGLLIFSKNSDAYHSLKTQFFQHTVTRAYAALVHGKLNPANGRIESYLKERADGVVYSARGGQRAISDYETLDATKQLSLLRVTLLSGRKHQIRVHLSERGHPIVGDTVYGKGEVDGVPLRLIAVELQFDHPRSGKRMKFEKPIPAVMKLKKPSAPEKKIVERKKTTAGKR